MAEPGAREVYFEFIAIGNAVKVTAIDLQQLALQKLKMRLKRE